VLLPGTKLGPYEITAPLGAGGMGEVYRARDSRLGRDVALKVLPEVFAADAQRMARFEREAKVLASLNHPGIASIYGLEESGSARALVMELVEGPMLSERIAQGAIPMDEALPIARQICEGLEYAHERGIIHRDLKPANVKLTPEGAVKLLDFGLAKALEDEAVAGDPSTSPTISRLSTQAGVILGTAAYMSPEQARGRPADRRADIWAFGCLLYEMLTAKRAFGGENISETLAAIMRDEPDWRALPQSVPPRIRELLKRCLSKDVKQRLQAIGDARIAIEEALSGADAVADLPPALAGATAGPASRWTRALPWALSAILAAALAAALVGLRQSRGPVMRLSLAAQPFHSEARAGSALAISPDGTRVAYISLQRTQQAGTNEDLIAPAARQVELVTRKFDQSEPTPLPGTTGAAAPFFSPDGRWIGFIAAGALKKVPSDGGPVMTLCDVPSNAGAFWGDDGFIYYALRGVAEIRRVPEEGGASQDVLQAAGGEQEAGFRWPHLLPGGKAVLFTTVGVSYLAKHSRIETYSFSSRQRTVLLDEGANARYLAPGYLVFTRGDVLMGAPFDARGLKVTGPAIPLIEGVTTDPWFGAADYALSSTGTLLYLTGGVQTAFRLVTADASGKAEPLGAQERGFEDLSLSPDGQRIVTTIVENGKADLWIYDRARDALTQLTNGSDCADPLWSPEGTRVICTRTGLKATLVALAADGSSPAEPLMPEPTTFVEADSFSPDGGALLYSTFSMAANNAALWLLPLKPSAPPKPLISSTARVFDGSFSPDGRWIAYVSAQSGSPQVYLQAYPGPGERVQASTEGGSEPLWAPNGSELYFRNGSKFMAVDVKLRPALAAGKPRLLFEGNYVQSHHDFALLPDGRHFILIQPVGAKLAPADLHVVVNWSEELKARAAAARN